VNHEEAFVRAFVVSEKQARYLALLSAPKRRPSLLNRLNHQLFLDVDPALAVRIESQQQTPKGIEMLLRKKGAPQICHVISSAKDLDGRDLALRQALDAIVGFGMGTVLCCIPGNLAYYEAEDPSERFILAR
jgi:hypothetical protein